MLPAHGTKLYLPCHFCGPNGEISSLIRFLVVTSDYAELSTEMLSKRVKYSESLELYYYEKINLLNRCEISGKRAVDCLLYGIEDRFLRLGAKAAKCPGTRRSAKLFPINQTTNSGD